ncbi:hypothetical protein ACWDTP_23240 [Mycobacterium sp. NPDC003449]
MDVVLGVAVTGRVARLAMIGAPASGGEVLDQYALDLPDDAMTELADTIVGTYRAVAESGNRIAATRLCLPDTPEADTLRRTVTDAGVTNVEVVAEAEAAAALARSAGADAALLLADDDTVSLTAVGEDEQATAILGSAPIGSAGAAAACASVLRQVSAGEAPTRVMLVGQRLDLDSVAAELRSMTPVVVPPDAGYAIARGAAQTVDGSGFAPAGAATQMAPALDATQMAPASDATQLAPASESTQLAPAAEATQMAPARGDAAAVGPDLAYSQDPGDEPWSDYDEMPMDPLGEFVPEQEEQADHTTVIGPPPPRMVLMGSAMTFLVISFATLAVTIAVNVRPAADVSAQPVTATQADTVPGRYLPPVPHEPDPVALPVSVLTPAPAAPPVRQDIGNQPVNRPPAAPPVEPAPPPVAPPAPAPAPAPPVVIPPVPVPPIIVVPTLPTWTPPTFTTTTPTTTPSTTTPTTTTPTTTTPTTTTTPPTTTTVPTTTVPTTTVPTTTATTAPTRTSTVPTSEPTYTAPVEEPTYTAPVEEPTYTAPVEEPTYTIPEQSSGGGSSSGDDSSGGGGWGDDSSGGGSPVTTLPESP